jgi:hypothetical protein
LLGTSKFPGSIYGCFEIEWLKILTPKEDNNENLII